MFKKILFGALTILLALSLVGCGEEKVESTPDKAVLAYAELGALGMSDESASTGLAQEDIDKMVEQWDDTIFGMFDSMFPLSEESTEQLINSFYGHLATEMEIRTSLKKEDKDHPVVELTAKPLNAGAAKVFTENSEDMKAIYAGLQAVRQSGHTDDEMRQDAEFQKKLVEAIEKYIDNFPVDDEATIEVTCKKMKGADGKTYWAPEDPVAVVKFVTGQK